MLRLSIVSSFLGLFSSLLVSALKISSSLSTIEYTPELVASQTYFKNGTVSFVNGGVANIVTDTSIDLASNAETQALRQYATHKNLRIIYTVCEVTYRIVANKKTITSLKDLKGKRVGTFPGTSASYFVEKYLNSVGLGPSDYTTTSGNLCTAAPCGAGTLPYMLQHGTVDAIGVWEPTVQLAIDAMGDSATTFYDRSIYREVFNLHSTTDKLKDPTTRAQIVAFIKALNQAEDVFEKTPDTIYPTVSKAVSESVAVLKEVWPYHAFNNTQALPSDLLDFMVAEDVWVAQQDRRAAMTKEDIAGLIDATVLADALKS